MNRDIYFYVERKIDGVWQQQFKKDVRTDNKFWYEFRHYWLFSLLAGVEGPFIPLAEPKGLPDDLSDGLKAEWESHSGQVNTPSYYTLSQLLAAQDIKETFTGYVDAENYKKFKKTGRPDAWNMTPYKGTKVLSNAEMDKVMKFINFWNGDPPYTEITFDGSNKDIGKKFWEETVSAMKELDDNADNVRCVFWFDK
jgi:hypothetical protein